MKAGTVIQLDDGRVGTICYRSLDGEGGVWGRHNFSGINVNFNDDWPAPEFMLRDEEARVGLERFHGNQIELVGEHNYEVLEEDK